MASQLSSGWMVRWHNREFQHAFEFFLASNAISVGGQADG